MPSVTYQPTADKVIEERVHNRYCKEIEALRPEGFEPWYVVEELLFPFSLFISLIIIPLMLAYRQTFRVKHPLRMALYDLTLINRQQGTVATLGGMGMKFHTRFTDGTLVASGKAAPSVMEDKSFRYYQSPRSADFVSAWRFHQAKVDALLNDGKQIQPTTSFHAYLEASQRSAASIMNASLFDATKRSKPGKLFRYGMIGITVIYAIAFVLAFPALLSRAQADPLRGVGYILAGIVTLGNSVMASWDAYKDRFEEIFFFPQTARWARLSANLLLGAFLVAMLLRGLEIISTDVLFALGGLWFVYGNCLSLYFRVKRQLNP